MKTLKQRCCAFGRLVKKEKSDVLPLRRVDGKGKIGKGEIRDAAIYEGGWER